jgi:hypothetical protein
MNLKQHGKAVYYIVMSICVGAGVILAPFYSSYYVGKWLFRKILWSPRKKKMLAEVRENLKEHHIKQYMNIPAEKEIN